MRETEHLLLYTCMLDCPVRTQEDASSSDSTVLASGIWRYCIVIYRTCYGVRITVCSSTYSAVACLTKYYLSFWVSGLTFKIPTPMSPSTRYVKSVRLICGQNMHVKLLLSENCLLGCDAMWCSGRLPTVWRNFLSPFSWLMGICVMLPRSVVHVYRS